MTPVPATPLAFRPAVPADEPALRALLDAEGLPSEDVRCGAQELITAWDGPALAGAVGLERHGEDALLRSLVVARPFRGRGLGDDLSRRAVARARELGVRTLYLLTTTAEGFFAARGFARVDRASVPAAVSASTQFAGLCAVTTPCLAQRLRE